MMKKILTIIIMLLLLCPVARAQDDIYRDTDAVEQTAPAAKETSKERKEREKRLQERVDSLAHVKSMGAIMRDHFVLLAEQVSLGNMGYVHSGLDKSTNFIVVQGERAMVQFALNDGSLGANGLGGLTVAGRVTNKRVTQDGDGGVMLTFHVMGSRVNADVSIQLYPDCDSASAMVMATFSSDRITMYGRLLPYNNPDLNMSD